MSRKVMPSQVRGGPGLFDKFATRTEQAVAHAWFFALCLVMVVGWLPTMFLMPIDSSQLIINTSTTIITFLLVALLQNTQKRGNDAIQKKLNAVASALEDLLQEFADTDTDVDELRQAVGLEKREST